ncbi:MAG: glycosyltransferase [Prevotella sp.]|nr:glycosyltransferase [Prevotella sp.]
MMKAIVNPLNHILYSSFYIYALRHVLGRDAVRFDSTPFQHLSASAQQSKGLLFIIRQPGHPDKKYYLYGNDSYRIEEEIYEWCDVYASVNANFEKTPGRDKLVSLTPSFGIRVWNAGGTFCAALSNAVSYIRTVHDHKLKTFLGNYKRLLNRPYYADLTPGSSRSDYVFFCSTLWYNDEYNQNDRHLNARRARFIRACKELEELRFEGGFVPQQGRSSTELFRDCLSDSSYPYQEWLQKTKQSALVFNTPAFWDCHGWKLGEYLALGKAIVSTPLSNDLPAPLTHGVNIHFVEDDIDSMKDVIGYIIHNQDYRKRLERGAREYWEAYGTPEKTLESIGIFTQR